MKDNRDDMVYLKELIHKGEADTALILLHQLLADPNINVCNKEKLHYLAGNAYRKKGNFRLALDHYQLSIDMDPDSPAVEARKALLGILEFYNKDMYNH